MEYIELSSNEQARQVMDSAEVSNKRYEAVQFQKYMSCCGSDMKWLVSYFGGEPKAMLAYEEAPVHGVEGTYVCMVQAFQSGHGYGKDLLEEMARRHPSTWLFANADGGQELVDFYRTLGWHERVTCMDDGRDWHSFSAREMSCQPSK